MVLIGALVITLGGCGNSTERPTDLDIVDPGLGVEYLTIVSGAPDDDIDELIQQSLKLYTLAHRKPSSPARLRRRAESDMGTAVMVLRSEGYYISKASFEIAPAPVPVDAPVTVRGQQAQEVIEDKAADATIPDPPLAVTVTLNPGPRFKFATMLIEPTVTAEGLKLAAPDSFGFESGSPARAADIVEAESRAVLWLTERGYPYARFEDRKTTADLQKHTLNVVSTLTPGPRVRFGKLRFEGLKSVQQDYLESYTPWKENALYSRSAIDRFQTSLFATSLFDSISVEPIAEQELLESANDATAARPVAITISATEAKHRSVGAGARFSTDQGPEATAFFEHRNVFGANETGRISVIGGLLRQEINLSLRKPQFLHQPNVLFGSLVMRHEDDDAFEERTLRLVGGIERRMNKRLTVSGALSLELSQIDDEPDGQFETAQLIGVPLTARYDASNSVFDPTRGWRVGTALTPYTGTYNDNTLLFTSADLNGSVYYPIDDAQRYVLALRGRVGTLLGAERDDLPPTKRLYSGGGGSVRGYESRFIGPLDVRGDPLGGRSVLEAGIEMRIRIGENFGLVPFIDAGTVSSAIVPDFNEDVQIAAGLGVRYYTIIGPIRADLAVPVNPREEDSAFQFYISIGQAF